MPKAGATDAEATRIASEMVGMSDAKRLRHGTVWFAACAAFLLARQALASEGGLELIPTLDRLIPLLVLFALVVLPTNALLFRPVFRALDAREERIAGSRRRADQLARDADAILERYESAVQGAREDAERDRTARLEAARALHAEETGRARAESEAEIARARDELAAGLAEARAALGGQARELARQAAARVLGRALS